MGESNSAVGEMESGVMGAEAIKAAHVAGSCTMMVKADPKNLP